MNKIGFNFSIAMMLCLSILLPTVLVPVKTALLLLALIMAAALHFQGGAKIARFTLITTLIYVCAGLLWSIFGLIKGNPGAIAVLTVMGIYPVIFTFLASAYKPDDRKSLTHIFVILALLLGLLDLIYILGFLLAPQNVLQLFIEGIYQEEVVVDASENYFKFTIPNISSCIFLLPFLIASFIHSNERRLWTGAATIVMFAVMLLSGRRGFAIAAISGLLIAHMLTYRSQQRFKFKIKINSYNLIGLFITLICLVWFFTSFYGAEFYLAQIKSILDFTTNESNIERSLQFDSMMGEFSQSPVFGAGAGAAAQYNRSVEQPWAYELAYVAFLFQYGALGFLLYAAGILLLIYHLVAQVKKNGRNSFEFFYLAGFISFMAANATNPYLAKYDYMWLIFIPVAIMNNSFLCKPRRYPN